MGKEIFITATDKQKLEKLIMEASAYETYKKDNIKKLEEELLKATIVSQENIPDNVVTMNSHVVLENLETGETESYTLVYPHDADVMNNKISIMAPVGTAILGYQVGDIIEWPVPAGTIKFKILKIVFQPEANGNFEL
ncbi:MAG: nucleoside diphosphate kinase regulator [Eubacteriales bacterium]|nr:nucleoside diphosphate kinase regulator [Eubacteriales bacterium]